MKVVDNETVVKQLAIMIGDTLCSSRNERVQILDCLQKGLANYTISGIRDELSTELCKNDIVIKNFLGIKRLAGLRESTLEAYRITLSQFLRFCNVNLVLTTTDDIRRFLLWYEGQVSRATVDNARRNLNSFFNFMEDEGYITKNPCRRIDKIKAEKKTKRFYTSLEMEMMRDACNCRREIALIDLLLSTGARISEVCGIRVNEVDWNNDVILLHGKGAKDRYVPISPRCKKHLIEYLEERGINNSEYLFCSDRKPYHSLSKYGINKIIKEIGNRVNLPDISVHCFRRFFATDLSKKGVEPMVIQELLGHSSYNTTKNYYVEVNRDKIRFLHNIYAM